MDKNLITNPDVSFDDTLDNIAAANSMKTDCGINDLEIMALQLLKSLPKLNRDAIRQEMNEMIVETYENPTTFQLSEGLQRAQAYKDRIISIYNIALRDFKMKKRCMEMLSDATVVISKASSQDKRKGEVALRYPILLLQLEASETFLKEMEHILNNIRSAFDCISRQTTILTAQITLGEIRGNGMKGSPASYPKSDAEEIGTNNFSKVGETTWDDL